MNRTLRLVRARRLLVTAAGTAALALAVPAAAPGTFAPDAAADQGRGAARAAVAADHGQESASVAAERSQRDEPARRPHDPSASAAEQTDRAPDRKPDQAPDRKPDQAPSHESPDDAAAPDQGSQPGPKDRADAPISQVAASSAPASLASDAALSPTPASPAAPRPAPLGHTAPDASTADRSAPVTSALPERVHAAALSAPRTVVSAAYGAPSTGDHHRGAAIDPLAGLVLAGLLVGRGVKRASTGPAPAPQTDHHTTF